MKKTDNGTEEKKTLEEKLSELDNTIEQLGNKDITLEQSFELYKTGMELLKECNDDVDTIEKKVLVLKENGELDEL